MPYIADSYLRAREALDRISQEVTESVNRRERAIEQISQQVSTLTNLALAHPSGWFETLQFIDTKAAELPLDNEWQSLRAIKNKIRDDLNSEKTKTQSIIDAINTV